MSHTAKVQIGSDKARHTETYSSPHTYAHGQVVPPTVLPDAPLISNIRITSAVSGFSKRRLNENEEVKVEDGEKSESTTRRVEKMTFDVERISPPIANMIRRLIMTEVPVLAFDRILIEENDSVVPDELLAHRIGLVPVAGPTAKMEYVTEATPVGFDNLDPKRVLAFELTAEGRRDVQVTNVYSGGLKWVPLPGQTSFEEPDAPDEDRVFIVHPDIILTKLGPGQRVKLRVIAVRGIGTVHAKWIPTSACFYELQTEIHLKEPIRGADAEKLCAVCPKGVFVLDDNKDADIVDVENCTLCRECLRREAYPEFADKIVIEKNKTRMRFTIESIGQLHPTQILRHALTLFAERVKDLAERIRSAEVNVACNKPLM